MIFHRNFGMTKTLILGTPNWMSIFIFKNLGELENG